MRDAQYVKYYSVVKSLILIFSILDPFSVKNQYLLVVLKLIFLPNVNQAAIHAFCATPGRWLELSTKQSIEKKWFSRGLRPNDRNHQDFVILFVKIWNLLIDSTDEPQVVTIYYFKSLSIGDLLLSKHQISLEGYVFLIQCLRVIWYELIINLFFDVKFSEQEFHRKLQTFNLLSQLTNLFKDSFFFFRQNPRPSEIIFKLGALIV